MKTFIVTTALSLALPLAVAAPPKTVDDYSCHNFAGQMVNTPECRTFLREQQPLSDNECAESETCRAAQAARAEARRVRRAREEQARQEAIESRVRQDEAREVSVVATIKAKCGDDFRAPRVGMTISRAKECVSSNLRVTGQLNRADGVVTTYQSPSGAYFHVMNGTIVAWGR